MSKRRSSCLFWLLVVAAVGGCALLGLALWPRLRGVLSPAPLPRFPPSVPYDPWPTPPAVGLFDYPLLPAASYGPYARGITGDLTVDTRYARQNPAMGQRSNCFVDVEGNAVPFSELYHAGVDLFALDGAGRVVWGGARRVPVHAVADGVVAWLRDAGAEGRVVAVEHRLGDGSAIYSVYWHVSHVQVRPGQPVERGQVIAVVHDQGLNSHLHWEMRTFRDGSDLFPAGSAGERGTCNGHVIGVGYTWDDVPARGHPDAYGYLDPMSFVAAHRPVD